MGKFQVTRVKGDPWRPAGIRQRRSMKRPVVHLLAAKGRSRFSQVDADLVRAAGFQPAFHPTEPVESLHEANMGYRVAGIRPFLA
jgi:hypothetical protein